MVGSTLAYLDLVMYDSGRKVWELEQVGNTRASYGRPVLMKPKYFVGQCCYTYTNNDCMVESQLADLNSFNIQENVMSCVCIHGSTTRGGEHSATITFLYELMDFSDPTSQM